MRIDEADYDRVRLGQWLTGHARGAGVNRRDLLRAMFAVGVMTAVPLAAGARPATADGPIIKPLPPDLFDVFGSNAEMRWESMRDQGFYTPTDRFFVRDHTATPLIDAATWRLRLFGDGLRQPMEIGYDELRRLPATEISSF